MSSECGGGGGGSSYLSAANPMRKRLGVGVGVGVSLGSITVKRRLEIIKVALGSGISYR